MGKKISIIIPCYNVEKFLDRCMHYLTTQTIGFEENVELIMVNDCSTDGTLKKLQEYEAKYPENICLIPLEKNVKQGAARNIALQYATGDYVCYCDADDYLVPTALEKLYRVAKQNRAEITAYLFKFAYDETTEEEIMATKSDKPNQLFEINSVQDRKDFLFSGNIIRGCWNKLYDRQFVLDNQLKYAEGIFDEESLFTYPAYMVVKRYYCLNEYLYMYYQNDAGTCYTLAKSDEHRNDNALCWLQVYEDLKNKGVIDDYYREIEIVFIHNFYLRSYMYSIRRGIRYDVKTVRWMQETVQKLFPDYKNNPLRDNDPFIKKMYPTIWARVDEYNIEKYNALWEKATILSDMEADFSVP